MSILLNQSAPASSASRPASANTERERIKIVLVDDDNDYREAASNELEYLGFDVVAFPTGEALLGGLAEYTGIEVIVLDWKLPEGLGIDLLLQLRERGCTLPVIFLTAVPATAYESAALDGGAVDFVDKARGITILAKRIRSCLDLVRRIPGTGQSDLLRCGPLVLRPDGGGVRWRDADPELTVTELNIVHLLASRAGDYVTYRAIYDCVHRPGFVAGDGAEGFRTNVRSSIKRIRNKFRAVDPSFDEIENFAAFGYRWRGDPAASL